jgi:hypothetical protein
VDPRACVSVVLSAVHVGVCAVRGMWSVCWLDHAQLLGYILRLYIELLRLLEKRERGSMAALGERLYFWK